MREETVEMSGNIGAILAWLCADEIADQLRDCAELSRHLANGKEIRAKILEALALLGDA